MPVIWVLALSGLIIIALVTLGVMVVVAQLSAAVEVIDNHPWESI
jgi:hypothetical protein